METRTFTFFPVNDLTSIDNNPKDAEPAAELVGQELGDYVILRRLGAGGMATVYLAEQKSLKRKVALKVMHDQYINDPTYVSRFIREAQSAASLVQSNIVQIYEVGQKSGKHFIAQEYVSGRNLRQFLSRYGAVESIMALNVLRQVGLALQKSNEFGVIHRDIKPENIMIASTGEVKVTDFGLARVVNKAAQNDLTQVGIAMGTPLYMSPEQIEGREIDHRTDIYSLGITAYHMLAGHPPFDGETALAVALQHLNNAPKELAKIRPDVPRELCELIERMMAKKPEDRIQSASDLLRDLRKIKIDDAEDWESLAEKLADSALEHETVTGGKLAATRHLQSVLQGNFPSAWKMTGFVIPLALVIFISLGIGVALAWVQPVPDPFAMSNNSNSSQKTPKKENVQEQYRAAFWSGNPDDYKSVFMLFPAKSDDHTTLYYHWLAKRNLGILLLQSKNKSSIAEAEQYFRELSELETFPTFQAAGLAGLACVYDEFEFTAMVREELERLDEPTEIGPPFALLDKYLQERVSQLMEKYNSTFNSVDRTSEFSGRIGTS